MLFLMPGVSLQIEEAEAITGLLGFTEAAESPTNFYQGLSRKQAFNARVDPPCQLWAETVTDSFLTSISLFKGQAEAWRKTNSHLVTLLCLNLL